MELLIDKKLNNGMHLSFYNDSRKVAGDRWLVVLKLETSVPLTEKMLDEISNSDECDFLLDKFNGNLSFVLERKRHFVDEKEVEGTLEDLMLLAENNWAEYLDRDDFAQQLFKKKLAEFEAQFLLEKQTRLNEAKVRDVEEPDDFSACFK